VVGGIEGVAFDCFGTLIDFSDEAFAKAYGVICAEQGLPVSGEAFYEKWMEVWRRLARDGASSSAYGMGFAHGEEAAAAVNRPAALSAAETVPGHPEHHRAQPVRARPLDGPVPPFRTYREEWTEHFALCFEEMGLQGDAAAAHERLRQLIAQGAAFPDSRRTVETIGRRLPTALMSNADDDFLYPCLGRNGLAFPVVVTSEEARTYKPHVAIFRRLCEAMALPPDKVLYVGDSRLADVTGAKHAGLKAAWVNRARGDGRTSEWGSRGRELLEPDFEVDSLTGLLEVLGLQ